MAYDAQLAARVRKLFADDPAVREQTMFGARAFLVDGRVQSPPLLTAACWSASTPHTPNSS